MAVADLFHRILGQRLASRKETTGAEVVRPAAWRRYQFDLPEPTDAAAEIDGMVYKVQGITID